MEENQEKPKRLGLYEKFKHDQEEKLKKEPEEQENKEEIIVKDEVVENVNNQNVKIQDKIEKVDINLLDGFKTHIFSKLPQEKFEELKKSISRNGVLSPIIIRKKDDRYEIIAGHNRVNCCKELEIKEVPCIIKNYNDDEAELVMIETNLSQREEILLCEKGLAYKKELELLKKLKKEKWGETLESQEIRKLSPQWRQFRKY